MSRTQTKADRPTAGRFLNTPIHPDVLKELKVESIRTDTLISDILHSILCDRYQLHDLADQAPEGRRVALTS